MKCRGRFDLLRDLYYPCFRQVEALKTYTFIRNAHLRKLMGGGGGGGGGMRASLIFKIGISNGM